MDFTTRHNLPYLLPNQAQKHVTLNESLAALDTLTGLCVKSRAITAEPASPTEGDTYILPAAPSGASWSGMAEGEVATFRDGAWFAHTAPAGLRAWIEDEALLAVRTGGAWVTATPAQHSLLGINTNADTTNRLSVKSDAVLLSHDDVTPGSGDMRQFVNKAASGDTASLLFSTAYQAHAELGLVGANDLSLRVSPDGSAFNTGLTLRASDGAASFPSGFASPDTILADLFFRHSLGNLSDDSIATVDFGSAVYGSAILAIPNLLTAGPMVLLFARMATSPSLEAVFSSGASYTTTTGELTGTTGADGGINFSATEDGRFIIENRRGYVVGYTVYAFKR